MREEDLKRGGLQHSMRDDQVCDSAHVIAHGYKTPQRIKSLSARVEAAARVVGAEERRSPALARLSCLTAGTSASSECTSTSAQSCPQRPVSVL